LGGKEAISKMKVLDGFEVRLFASEEKFPELANPVQMAFDTKGRLWVAVWPSYPHWKPKDEMNDKLLIFEDTNGDGEADVCKTFASGLHNPTGFEFWNGGVYVAQVPDLLFLQDADGDDKADKMDRVLHGIDSADTHHSINSFTVGPDGGLYFQEGTFHTQVESPFGIARSANAGSFRFEPRTGKFDLYTAVGYANPHGHVFDLYGTDILHDGTGSNPYDAAFYRRIDYPNKHRSAPQVYGQRTRPCPATEDVSGGHFPEEMAGELLVENVIGDLGISATRLKSRVRASPAQSSRHCCFPVTQTSARLTWSSLPMVPSTWLTGKTRSLACSTITATQAATMCTVGFTKFGTRQIRHWR
jgi:hypothetical protein